MFGLIIAWLVTAVSLIIIAQIDFFGIRVKDFSTALIVALVLGVLNAVLRPILGFLALPLLILTLGLFSFVINAIVFWLASQFVSGFTLTKGWVSALLGPIALGLLNALIMAIIR